MIRKFLNFIGFCQHKFEKYDNDRLICEKCGKIEIIPCSHKFIEIGYDRIEIKCFGQTTGFKFIRTIKCEKCGEIKYRIIQTSEE